MEKISLYNFESDTLVEIEASPEDIRRAENDAFFATQLMNDYLKKSDSSSHQEILESSSSITNAMEKETASTVSDTSEVGDSPVYRWSNKCVMFFLETYKCLEYKFSEGKYPQKKVWDELSKILSAEGYNVTGPQCSAKLRSLKKTYKSIKDHNNKSGNDRRSWPFFDIMHEIFSTKAWSNPVAVASSTGLTTQVNDANPESESGNSTESSVSKENVKSLLAKRLRQKEVHEENRNKRHKERMDMDAKFLEVLQKLSDK